MNDRDYSLIGPVHSGRRSRVWWRPGAATPTFLAKRVKRKVFVELGER